MSEGIIYYNIDRGALVRLTVSLHTLRKIYDGPIGIVCNNPELCSFFAKNYGASINYIELVRTKKNTTLLNKCLLHKWTPFDKTIFVDADTIVLKPFWEELFKDLDTNGFLVSHYSEWSNRTRRIKLRLKEWEQIHPRLYKSSIKEEHPAVNTGTFAFSKNSLFMKDWYAQAMPGYRFFIPDEVCCQLMLGSYSHKIISNQYNVSCNHGTITEDSKIIHFHGRKHCRIDGTTYLNNSHLWYEQFKEVYHLDFIKDNIQFDKQLKENIKKWISLS